MIRRIKKLKLILSLSLIACALVATIGTSINADAAKKKSSETTYAVGDDIAFGVLDGRLINWTILSYDDTTKTALIISKYTLNSTGVQQYRAAINQQILSSGGNAGYVQWANNYWRGWCNQLFYNNCFTDEERAKIIATTLTDKAAQASLMNFYHDQTLDDYYIKNGRKNSLIMSIYDNQTTTTDYIFFLSTDEYTTYKDTIKYETVNTWPLRTNAYDDPAQGLFVNDKTKLIQRQYYYSGDGVRPAMYVQLGEPETEDADSSSDTSSAKTDSNTTDKTESDSKTASTTKTASASTTASKATATSTKKTTTTKSKKYANNGTDIGSIRLPEDSTYTMSNGGSAQVALNLDYLNSTDKQYTVTYKSSNASVFTVDSNGSLTATGSGTGTLTVRMKKSNGKVYTMTCRIDVS